MNNPMRERPILFSAPMVRALLDGTKTQTRRAVKPQPYVANIADDGMRFWNVSGVVGGRIMLEPDLIQHCPYGQPGDRLWVKETWGYRGASWCSEVPGVQSVYIDYRADGEYKPGGPRRVITRARDDESGIPKMRECRPDEDYVEDYYNGYLNRYWKAWRPSIHMSRWMSRITLEITDVRVQRLQECSEEDARAEGARCVDRATGREVLFPDESQHLGSWKLHFSDIWNSINGAGAWDANPWVWALTFKRVAAG